LSSPPIHAPLELATEMGSTRKTDGLDLAKSSQVSNVDRLVRGIIEGFREGRYQPGERLVAADLAAEFNVSRAPVREALAVLVGEGVVEIKKNYGARLRAFSVDELVEIMEVTEAALVLGVRKCAERISTATVDEVARLDESFEQMEAAWHAHDAANFVDCIYHFHNVINAIAGNRFLAFVYQRPHFAFFNRHLAGALPGTGWEEYLDSYRRVYRTIRRGQVHAAQAAFSAHMQWAISLIK
jgi:DNA-binding GntR family transcriptional regulator